MTTRTAEEVEREHVTKMGARLGRIYNRLYNECLWLHVKWSEYVELYGTTPERVDLLNQAAPSLFGMLDSIMWNDVLLHIARLTDQAKTARRETLSINQLPGLVAPELQTEMQRAVAKAEASAGFARDWRHRLLAHTDLALALRERHAQPLKNASRAHVKTALKDIAAALNVVDKHYCGAEVGYDISDGDGAVTLLHRIREGVEANTQRLERIRSRTFTPDDVKHRPI